jgi:hypothetical protein
MKKRYFAAVFALCIGTALSAQNPADFQYTTATNGSAVITGYTGSAKNVTIPDRIDNLPVTAIGYRTLYAIFSENIGQMEEFS